MTERGGEKKGIQNEIRSTNTPKLTERSVRLVHTALHEMAKKNAILKKNIYILNTVELKQIS